MELEIFPTKPVSKNSNGKNNVIPIKAPEEGVYVNLCSSKQSSESQIGVFGSLVSQVVITKIPKKYALIFCFIMIALSHQIAQIGVWKSNSDLGNSMSMVAFLAETISKTIIIVWIADNIPTNIRGVVMSISIYVYMGVR